MTVSATRSSVPVRLPWTLLPSPPWASSTARCCLVSWCMCSTARGQLVTSDNTTVIQIAIETNPTGGTLSGTASLQVVNGVADFDDLSIDRRGQGYRLQASVLSRGMPPIQTGFFNVVNDGILQDRFEAPTDDVFQDRFELQ